MSISNLQNTFQPTGVQIPKLAIQHHSAAEAAGIADITFAQDGSSYTAEWTLPAPIPANDKLNVAVVFSAYPNLLNFNYVATLESSIPYANLNIESVVANRMLFSMYNPTGVPSPNVPAKIHIVLTRGE